MAMMPHPRDRAHSGWGTALGSPPSDPLPPRTSSLSWPVERPESGAVWSEPPIDTILAEFTSRWERSEEPSIDEFLTLISPARASDAATLDAAPTTLCSTSAQRETVAARDMP